MASRFITTPTTTLALLLLTSVVVAVRAQDECFDSSSNSTLSQGTVCRAAVSICDVVEVCDGDSRDCPSDAFAPSTTVVHPTTSTDNCDPTEFCSGTDANVPENVDNCVSVTIDVVGQSGKFYVYPDGESRSSEMAVVVEIDSLEEVDAQGDAVGTAGPQDAKHVINSFATQQFTIDDPVDDAVNGIDAQKISFHSSVNTIGSITFDTYVLKSAGTIGTDTESWDARASDVKWNIVLSNWTWCGSGNEPRTCDAGEYVDVVVKIKGKKTQTNATDEKTIDLGDDVALELSDRVKIGNNWTAMPSGYPHMTVQGNSAYFHFRFPYFGTETATYDPFMSTSSLVEDEAEEDDDDSVVLYIGVGVAGVVGVLFVAVIAYFMSVRGVKSGKVGTSNSEKGVEIA